MDAATFAHALSDTLQLARRYKLSVYEASYLELAIRSGLPLATLNEDLQKAAKQSGRSDADIRSWRNFPWFCCLGVLKYLCILSAVILYRR